MAPTPKAMQRNKNTKRDQDLAVSRQANFREKGVIGLRDWLLRGMGRILSDGAIL